MKALFLTANAPKDLRPHRPQRWAYGFDESGHQHIEAVYGGAHGQKEFSEILGYAATEENAKLCLLRAKTKENL